MKTVFVLGSEGIIGRDLVSMLKEEFLVNSYDLSLGHDLTDEQCVNSIFKDTECHGLVNLFALNEHVGKNSFATSYDDFDLDTIRLYMEVNVVALFNVCRTFIKYNQQGSVVNFSSIYGIQPPDNTLYAKSAMKSIGYSVSKSAVISLSQYFAKNTNGNFRFNVIAPGGVSADGQDPEFIQKYCKLVPLNRMCHVNDLYGPTRFLLSDESLYVNGVILPVDG